jgi:hypothetical protein
MLLFAVDHAIGEVRRRIDRLDTSGTGLAPLRSVLEELLPMKPMPETICAATRDGSMTTCSASTSVKPYFDTNMINAEAKPTSVWVRSPALFWRISRSSPIAAESARAISSSPAWGHP